MNDLTKASDPDPSTDPNEQAAAEAAGPPQTSDDSPDVENRDAVPPSGNYSAFPYWPWPELFDGFDEFVKKSREESAANRREPPPWW